MALPGVSAAKRYISNTIISLRIPKVTKHILLHESVIDYKIAWDKKEKPIRVSSFVRKAFELPKKPFYNMDEVFDKMCTYQITSGVKPDLSVYRSVSEFSRMIATCAIFSSVVGLLGLTFGHTLIWRAGGGLLFLTCGYYAANNLIQEHKCDSADRFMNYIKYLQKTEITQTVAE